MLVGVLDPLRYCWDELLVISLSNKPEMLHGTERESLSTKDRQLIRHYAEKTQRDPVWRWCVVPFDRRIDLSTGRTLDILYAIFR